MATETQDAPAPASEPAIPDMDAGEGQATSKKRFKISAKMLIIAGVVAVAMAGSWMLVEMLLAPSAASEEEFEEPDEHAAHTHGSTDDQEEILVGEFSTTNDYASAGESIHLRFKLYATVVKTEAAEIKESVETVHNARIRAAVIEVCRGASLDDLEDPELGVMRRKIRERINRMLGRTAVSEIYITDYTKLLQ